MTTILDGWMPGVRTPPVRFARFEGASPRAGSVGDLTYSLGLGGHGDDIQAAMNAAGFVNVGVSVEQPGLLLAMRGDDPRVFEYSEEDVSDAIDAMATLGECPVAWQPVAAANDATLQDGVTALLSSYPFLAGDPGYVAFLRGYGGALLITEGNLVMSVFGFSHDIGMHLVDGPGELISDGCLVFADMVIPREGKALASNAVGFGFEATGQRRSGVYRYLNGGSPAWYCETFLEWLRRVVASKGRMLD